LIVTAATEWMMPYHDRMPAVLQQAEIDRWLRGEMSAEELHPVPEEAFKEHKVSRRMNNTRVGDDDPTLLDRRSWICEQRKAARCDEDACSHNFTAACKSSRIAC
jgi:putative SOS response-associated peptidase YedK